ncbi:type-F conjugative transfer system pilin assembly protein TrbC [Desulfovibrio sp. OttesenSCG-928-F20]|nr:type-F conjugative transfer system pilin assembly protein TrbC [Desulfovibrio sp. OttesenSCG-928-F20]
MKAAATFLLLAAVFSTDPHTAAPAKETKIIERDVAGQQVRQPEKEAEWMEKLAGVDNTISVPDAAKTTAEIAVEGAKSQASLVKQYTQDVWHKLKSELESKGVDVDGDYLEKLADLNREADFYERTHIYLMVSESVPKVTLRNYLAALQDVPVAFILRGAIGDDPATFKPTQDWVQELLCAADNYCSLGPVDINPNLFHAFAIREVPAFVYVPDPSILESCGGGPLDETLFYTWYGDLPASYILERIQELRPDDDALLRILSKMRGDVQ